jgi:hypothetical protein
MDNIQTKFLESAKVESAAIQRLLAQDSKDLTPYEIKNCAKRAADLAAELNMLLGTINRSK